MSVASDCTHTGTTCSYKYSCWHLYILHYCQPNIMPRGGVANANSTAFWSSWVIRGAGDSEWFVYRYDMFFIAV